jgi:Skp family chaperone for outer membrane proteins
MYLNETEEILAIIVCFAIVVGFVVKTIQDVKTTVAEENAKFNQQKEDEAKVRQLIDFLDQRTELLKNVQEFQDIQEKSENEDTPS